MKVSLIATSLLIASVCASELPPLTIPSLITLIPTIFKCLIPSPSKLSTINATTIKIQYYFSSNTVLDPIQLNGDNLNLIDPLIPTKVIVHGWMQNESIAMYAEFRAAYLKRGNYNVITVDWSRYSNSIDYIESAYYVPKVGRVLGQFLQKLNVGIGIPFERMHLLGFSLGAHVSGFAGKEVQASNVGSMIGRITGMDPAGPCFGKPVFKPAGGRLSASDATSVEVIHSDSTWWGIQQNIGKVNFKMNGGTRVQPGCNDNLSFTFPEIFCSHTRSTEFYIGSILSNSVIVSTDVIFGENTPADTIGVYIVRTSLIAPYIISATNF